MTSIQTARASVKKRNLARLSTPQNSRNSPSLTPNPASPLAHRLSGKRKKNDILIFPSPKTARLNIVQARALAVLEHRLMILAVLVKGLSPDHLSLVLPLASPLDTDHEGGSINISSNAVADLSRIFARDPLLDQRWKVLMMDRGNPTIDGGVSEDVEIARLCAASILMDDITQKDFTEHITSHMIRRLRHVFQRFVLDRRIGVCVTTAYITPQLGVMTTRALPIPTDSDDATLVFLSVDLAFTSSDVTALVGEDSSHDSRMTARSRVLAEVGISELSLGDATGKSNTGAVALLIGPARLLNHACNPQLEMTASPKGNAVETVPVVGISRDKKQSLAPGTELFLSYGKTYFSPSTCLCLTCKPV